MSPLVGSCIYIVLVGVGMLCTRTAKVVLAWFALASALATAVLYLAEQSWIVGAIWAGTSVLAAFGVRLAYRVRASFRWLDEHRDVVSR